jgi:hypothetical protein
MELICEICTDEVKGKVVHARGKLRTNRKGETRGCSEEKGSPTKNEE